MKNAFQLVAVIGFGLCLFGMLFGLVALVDGVAYGAVLLGSGFTGILLSSIVWLLADIAQSVRTH